MTVSFTSIWLHIEYIHRAKHNLLDIILSLVRTSKVGYLRDIRRLTVALSRARLGMYILGRREVFEACYELRQAFELLLQRPDKLVLATGEMWPSERVLADEQAAAEKPIEGEAVMEGVEHLGQFVFEMTNTRLKQIRTERGLPDAAPVLEDVEPAGKDGEAGALGTIDEGEDGEGEGVPVDGFEAEED